ncbi:MAG: TonB-dependent siderophore receptor [Alphaproteobacteria bacterium]|nr:TonB-dependent siderophore receptor [Alphaproteobacteria bacterium]
MRRSTTSRSGSALLAATILTTPALAQTPADSPAGATTAPNGANVDEIIVTGRAQALYRVDTVTSGKLPTAPLTSPITITTITKELIADQGARDAQDIYRNISGVTVFSYAGVTARGFRQEENFYDGLRGDPYAGFSVPQLFNVERVEFLKGPAGMLYGPGAPGGLFNYITKRPSREFSARIAGIYGTEGRKGGSGEITGALPVADAAGRLGVFYEDGNQQRRNAASEILILDAGLSFDVGIGELILQASHYDQDLQGNRLRGVPTDDAGVFLADRRWNHNEASDFLRLESTVLQAKLEGGASDSITYDIGVRWNDGEENQEYHEPRGLFDSDGDGLVDRSIREFRDQTRAADYLSIGANLVWAQNFGSVDNRVLVGGDWFRQSSFFEGVTIRGRTTDDPGLPTTLSLSTPEYGVTDPSSYIRPAPSVTESTQTRWGLYALDEVTIGRLIATVGARFDRFEDVNDLTGESFEDEAVTFRAGLVYRVRDDVSIFGQWAESFEPQGIGAQNPLAGGPFEPTAGDIFEGGVRTDLFGGRVQSSLAAYQIKRTNVLQADPRGDVDGDGVDDSVAFGEVTSKGVEFDITADITPNWVATFSYGYNDTRITGDNGGGGFSNNVGDRFANAPENQAGFWTRYQIPEYNLAFALGGDYVDVRQSLSGQKVRPYTVLDASIIYSPGPWKALLRIDNLLDHTYAASGFIDRTGHFPGQPRQIFLEVSRSW